MQEKFGSHSFDYVCEITLQTDSSGQIKTFHPQAKYKNKANVNLHAYGAGSFCGFQIPKNLTNEGVFILTVDDRPHYVGKCVNLVRIFNNDIGKISPAACYEQGQPTNCRINKAIYEAVKSGSHVKLWFLPNKLRTQEIKSELIRVLNTRDKWNLTG